MKSARQQIIEQTINNSNRLSRDMVRTVATTSRTTACVIIKSRVVGSIDDTIDVKAPLATVAPFPPFPFPPSTLLLLLLFIQSDSFPRAEKQTNDDDDELLPLLLLENDEYEDDDKTNRASRPPPKLSALAESILFRHT